MSPERAKELLKTWPFTDDKFTKEERGEMWKILNKMKTPTDFKAILEGIANREIE